LDLGAVCGPELQAISFKLIPDDKKSLINKLKYLFAKNLNVNLEFSSSGF
jgi:hypothetical protein